MSLIERSSSAAFDVDLGMRWAAGESGGERDVMKIMRREVCVCVTHTGPSQADTTSTTVLCVTLHSQQPVTAVLTSQPS